MPDSITDNNPDVKQARPRPVWEKLIPASQWLKGYGRKDVAADLLAAVIVTIMLIPQSLAYALLAGLPPEVGLYASMSPLLLYALFGSSRTLAVGPVAVVSLMTASAVGNVAVPGTTEYVGAALVLAFLSGLFLVLMGILRLGFLANLLSHPVISGFITASGILIAASQIKHVLGVDAGGATLGEIALSLMTRFGQINMPTAAIGGSAILFLFWVRNNLKPFLLRMGISDYAAAMIARAGPVAAVLASILLVPALGLADRGVSIVGAIPGGLPSLTLPPFEMALWQELLPAAVLISIIGFVESVSVAHTLAAKRRQRIDPNQELIGLGAANLAAGVSGGYPVTGGFARSVINFDAGAVTPMAGVFTAAGIALTALFLTSFFYYLPKAVLAATIIVAVLALVDLKTIRRTWIYSKIDFSAMLATILVTLLAGVEPGILAGVVLSLALHIWRTGRPHLAVVGRIPGTEHFRNVLRHKVRTNPQILMIRIDESLYFANAAFLEDTLLNAVAEQPRLKHIVLLCGAVNVIDASALETLERCVESLHDSGVHLHLAEVKGPVMDRLERTSFLSALAPGRVFLSAHEAMSRLEQELEAPQHYGAGI
nr:sulfate permease [Luteithermobacter gelatinilyticus]